MRSSAISGLLVEKGLRIFTTTDLSRLAGISPGTASQILIRLSRAGVTKRLKRGIWANALLRDLAPYEAVPYLVSPWPSYVSLYSVLSDYGVIEEIPRVIYAVTSGPPRKLTTPVGSFHFHHLPEKLMWGYWMARAGAGSYPRAEPEKAFLDLCYLGLTIRSPLGLPRKRGRRWDLIGDKVRSYAAMFDFPPLKEYVAKEKFDRT